MKSFLLILVSFYLAYSELTKYQKDCEFRVNYIRRIRSQNYKIANMNKLKYDEELEEEAKKEKHGCSTSGFQEIIKNKMYSGIRVQEPRTTDHPTATKVACIQYYCSDIRLMSNETLYVIDKGKEGRIEGDPGTKCPPGRSTRWSPFCDFPPKLKVNIGIGASNNILMVYSS